MDHGESGCSGSKMVADTLFLPIQELYSSKSLLYPDTGSNPQRD